MFNSGADDTEIMAKLINSLNTCLPTMTAGERRFARRLESFLEDDYLCWYDIPIGKKRRYPDFIIFHPGRGILFLEIKDWKLGTIVAMTPTTADIITSNGQRKTVSNPIEQARQCGYQVVDLLQKDKQLQQLSGPHKGKLCMPYGYGVVFTNISRKQFNSGSDEAMRQRILPDHYLICKDEMTESADPEVFQEQLWGMFNYRFGGKLSLPQIDRVRGWLFPEIRIESGQMNLFEGEADKSETAAPDFIKVMDLHQEQLARNLGDGHRVIHGVAGSGKTMILGYRCLQLASALNKPILVLCFNITLAAKLRSYINAKGISGQVQVYHFHDWCGEQLRAYNVPIIVSDKKVYERQVDSVIKGVEDGLIPKGQYGALLIDEGHDFEAAWLSLITKMVDADTNSLLLLYDDAQSIYKRGNGLNFSLSSVGINAKGRTTILKLNYRNTQQILDFSYRFSKDYFSQSNETEIPLIEPVSAGIEGPRPTVKRFYNSRDENRNTVDCVQSLISKAQPLSEIAVLSLTRASCKSIGELFGKNNIPYLTLLDAKSKRNTSSSFDAVRIMTIASSKGLEFQNVIIIDASYMPKTHKTEKSVQLRDTMERTG